MEIVETSRGPVTILALDGHLDAVTTDVLWARWSALIQGGARQFVLDLEKLSYVSSAGLRVFLLAARNMKDPAGTILTCGLNARLTQIFSSTGFTKLFPAYVSLDDAVEALTSDVIES